MILVPIFIIGVPVLLSFLIYKLLKRKDVKPKWRLLAFLPILIVGYFVFDAFYPSADFYKVDFKEVTGTELPKNYKFEFKTAGYPDQHGDYTSVSIIYVGAGFYNRLQSYLTKNGLSENGEKMGCIEMNKAKQKLNGLKIEREFSKEEQDRFYYVAFLSDKKTVLVQRSSH